MLKRLFLLFLATFLMARDELGELKSLYKQNEFQKACMLAGSMYAKYKNQDEYINLYAFSCLKSDNINRLVLPIIKLYKNKSALDNSLYFATIFYQKKLLYYALATGEDISYINLPKTKYVLSIVFDKFVKKEYEKKGRVYYFKGANDKNYRLYLKEEEGVRKLFLDPYANKTLVRVRKYW